MTDRETQALEALRTSLREGLVAFVDGREPKDVFEAYDRRRVKQALYELVGVDYRRDPLGDPVALRPRTP